MNKNKLLKQVKTLHLDTNKDVIDKLISEWDYFCDDIRHLKLIDIKGIKPMTKIDETPISILREDEPKITFSKELFFKNAPRIKNDYILIKKMVKNE